MSKPLATLELNHAYIDLWEDNVVTRFKTDGAEVPAAPNGDETMLHTAIHEGLHSILAEAQFDAPSACLRGVADGNTAVRGGRAEEDIAYSVGVRMTQLVLSMARAGYIR